MHHCRQWWMVWSEHTQFV